MRDWISSDYPYKVLQFKVTAGSDGAGQLEYVCEAEPASLSSAAVWRIRKLVYDTDGFNTQVLWADGDRKFDNSCTNPSLLDYS